MLFEYFQLSAKLLDAVATRQVEGRECTSSKALMKHSRKKVPVSLMAAHKKSVAGGYVFVNTFAAAWPSFPLSRSALALKIRASSSRGQ